MEGADDKSSFRGHYSAGWDDLFELVWQGGGGQPAVSHLHPSSDQPPSEHEMAAWLCPILSGVDPATSDQVTEEIGSSGTMITTDRKGKLLATDGMSGTKTISCNMGCEPVQPVASRNYHHETISCNMGCEPLQPVASRNYHHEDTNTRSDLSEKKASGGSSSRKGSSHNSAEKRRRWRITERLRTLQQLVPGCDKSSQDATLDETIQYMKLLQNHIQAMSMRPVTPPSVATAGYAVLHDPVAPQAIPIPFPAAAAYVDPGTTVAAGGRMIPSPGMVPVVPFGAMLPYPQYNSVMMTAAAAMAEPLYRPASTVSTAAPDIGRDRQHCSVSMEEQQPKKQKTDRE